MYQVIHISEKMGEKIKNWGFYSLTYVKTNGKWPLVKLFDRIPQ